MKTHNDSPGNAIFQDVSGLRGLTLFVVRLHSGALPVNLLVSRWWIAKTEMDIYAEQLCIQLH